MRIPKQAKKVALGLSGGVDSAVSALLLKQAGYDVTGVFLECYNTPGCRTDADHQDALEVALALQLPFRVLDFKKAYQDEVITYFRDAYKAGFTPNPDVVCNREIKFGLFYDWAMSAGFDFVATGHYARVERRASNDERRNSSSEFGVRNQARNQEITSPHTSYPKLLQGVDKTKDQSYFLCQLSSEQLEHILFPLGHLTKSEVREFAQKYSLPVAQKADSQGICFIGEVSVKAFLISLGLKEKPGDVLFEDVAGTAHAIGTHDGAWFYTLGQRLGLNKRASKESIEAAGLDPSHLPPLFVLAKDMESNQLVVGLRESVHANQFNVGEIHWLDKRHESGSMNQELRVRIRHQGELVDATIETHTSNNIVHASQPLFGVAPGQIAVLYQDDVLVGWAEIQ